MVGCRDVSIYLGDKCNFDCVYCDRDYIATKIGSQHLTTSDVDLMIEFFKQSGLQDHPPEMFSFHGGEPFTYVKIMDKFMEGITAAVPGDYRVFVQTNGSQLLQHEWFFEKWGRKLTVSISYDFMFQDLNRTMFQVGPAIDMMHRHGVEHVQLQYVMPINDPRVFSFAALKSITDICFKHNVRHLDLIPLRHYRGKDKFKVIVDELDLPQFFHAFLKFIHMLYIYGIDVVVDGHGSGIDKQYFDNHKQMILSPDGYIYPEYDFLEYQRHETIIGQWKGDAVQVSRQRSDEDEMIWDQCITCTSRSSCGLKFLFGMFDVDPAGSKCKQFYEMLDIIILHTQKLKQKPSILEWVGV